MDDLISRQAAIDVIEKWLECSDYNEAERHIMRATESILYDLPSVNQQEPCEDAISRKALISHIEMQSREWGEDYDAQQILGDIEDMPSVKPQERAGRCKDCKYFEYDSVAKVDGIPLIVAHEICSRWGDGCKTSEDGYCFLFEPQKGADR